MDWLDLLSGSQERDVHLYVQIMNKLRESNESGLLPASSKLPTNWPTCLMLTDRLSLELMPSLLRMDSSKRMSVAVLLSAIRPAGSKVSRSAPTKRIFPISFLGRICFRRIVTPSQICSVSSQYSVRSRTALSLLLEVSRRKNSTQVSS